MRSLQTSAVDVESGQQETLSTVHRLGEVSFSLRVKHVSVGELRRRDERVTDGKQGR